MNYTKYVFDLASAFLVVLLFVVISFIVILVTVEVVIFCLTLTRNKLMHMKIQYQNYEIEHAIDKEKFEKAMKKINKESK